LVAVAVNEKGGRRLFFGRCGSLGRGSATRVSQGLLLAHHFNFRSQVADLCGEWSVLFRFGGGRGRLVGLVPRRGEPIGIDRFNPETATHGRELPAERGTRIGRVQKT